MRAQCQCEEQMCQSTAAEARSCTIYLYRGRAPHPLLPSSEQAVNGLISNGHYLTFLFILFWLVNKEHFPLFLPLAAAMPNKPTYGLQIAAALQQAATSTQHHLTHGATIQNAFQRVQLRAEHWNTPLRRRRKGSVIHTSLLFIGRSFTVLGSVVWTGGFGRLFWKSPFYKNQAFSRRFCTTYPLLISVEEIDSVWKDFL